MRALVPRLPLQRPPFAAALRKWRRGEDVTQVMLARRLQISAALLAAYEIGSRRPTQDVLTELRKMGFTFGRVAVAKARRARPKPRPPESLEDRPLGEW